MVENKRITERHKSASARSRNLRQVSSAKHITNKTPELQNLRNAEAAKLKKIVLFDSAEERDVNMNDSSSSNGSDVRIPNSVSFGRSSTMSARSSRSSGWTSTSSSSNITDSRQSPSRPQRSISTPALSRSSSRRSATRSVSDSVSTPRPLSRARMGSRSSFVSSEGLATPRNSSSRGIKRKDLLKLSKCDSMDSLGSDDYSPREAPPPLPQPLSPEMLALTEQSKMVWDQFSTHVKLIDDSSELIARRPRKTFNSSGIFQKAMEDLYGSPEYWKSRGVMKFQNRVGAIAKFASKFIVGARKVKAMHDSKGEESDEDDLFLDYEPSQETIENAQRGWRILRRHVQEMAAERRMNQTTLSWDVLRHTIKGISNMQRARIDLYQRYGILPIIKNDGTVVQENTMLSERARSALSSKPKPVTPMTRFSSASPTKHRTYSSIEGFSGTGANLNVSL